MGQGFAELISTRVFHPIRSPRSHVPRPRDANASSQLSPSKKLLRTLPVCGAVRGSALDHLHVASQREIIYLAAVLLTFPCIDPLPIGRFARVMKPTAAGLAVHTSADSKKDKVKGMRSSSATEGLCQAVFGRCLGSGASAASCRWWDVGGKHYRCGNFCRFLSASSHKQPWRCKGCVLAVPAFLLEQGGCDFTILISHAGTFHLCNISPLIDVPERGASCPQSPLYSQCREISALKA